MRKRTSRAKRHRHHVKVLKAEVMSPRIAWFEFLVFLKKLAKLGLILGCLAAVAYGIRQAIEHTFHRNPDFRLQVIDLSPNDALDETGLVEHLGIDLTSNIFDFETDALQSKLLEIPAIRSAKVKRELPGTLAFRITTRRPVAWIACPEEGHPASRSEGRLLVDPEGFAYPCPAGQLPQAAELPVFVLESDPAHPLAPMKTLAHPQYRHCVRLLDAFRSAFPKDIAMIESISRSELWALDLTTRSGTVATFGLGDHDRQLENFAKALHHARKKGYEIATINLIPKRNVPITVRGDDQPPRAIPVSEETLSEQPASRRDEDLRSLLNRN